MVLRYKGQYFLTCIFVSLLQCFLSVSEIDLREMFFYSCSWVISILEACCKIPHILLKSVFRGICSYLHFSFDKTLRDAWIEIRVLEGLCRLEARGGGGYSPI